MKRIATLLITIIALFTLMVREWPIFKHYDSEHLLNLALPLVGIVTGTVPLGGCGELQDWQVMNRPGIDFCTSEVGHVAPFFAIYEESQDGDARTKARLCPPDTGELMHYEGRPVNQEGLPCFSRASFDDTYLLEQVNLEDDLLPVSQGLQELHYSERWRNRK